MADLGFIPNKGTIHLSEGADWVCSLDTPDVWEDGTESWVEFPDLDIRWDGFVNAAEGDVSFKIEQSETTAENIPQGSQFRLYAKFPTVPSTEYLWFRGAVKRHD